MSWSEKQIQEVWEKGKIVPPNDADVYRKDKCGAWIKRSMFGNSSSSLSMGWEIDHIKPESKGGGHELSNLQPLQWENNRYKGDNYPNWDCKVCSNDTNNTYC